MTLAQAAEELADVVGQAFGLFQRGEVAASPPTRNVNGRGVRCCMLA
jgi:hypothetical protein